MEEHRVAIPPEKDAGDGTTVRTIVGSVDGVLLQGPVNPRAGIPAVWIKDRRSGEDILCTLTGEMAAVLLAGDRVRDEWVGHRVVARGSIHHGDIGGIIVINAQSIDFLRSVGVRGIPHDEDFTGGLDVYSYLDHLREGDKGELS